MIKIVLKSGEIYHTNKEIRFTHNGEFLITDIYDVPQRFNSNGVFAIYETNKIMSTK